MEAVIPFLLSCDGGLSYNIYWPLHVEEKVDEYNLR